jgi:HNH endonuclease
MTANTIPEYDHDLIAYYMAGADSRHLSDVLMREIYLRDNGTCQKCLRAVGPRAVHFDHIVPWSVDGETVPWNLQVLCESCNRAKGNRMDDQDNRKRVELGEFFWSLHVLRWAITEHANTDPTSRGDDWKPNLDRMIADTEEILDLIKKRLESG